jgi:hypothetical protein
MFSIYLSFNTYFTITQRAAAGFFGRILGASTVGQIFCVFFFLLAQYFLLFSLILQIKSLIYNYSYFWALVFSLFDFVFVMFIFF